MTGVTQESKAPGTPETGREGRHAQPPGPRLGSSQPCGRTQRRQFLPWARASPYPLWAGGSLV